MFYGPCRPMVEPSALKPLIRHLHLRMEEILHHPREPRILGVIVPRASSWCRLSSIHRMMRRGLEVVLFLTSSSCQNIGTECMNLRVKGPGLWMIDTRGSYTSGHQRTKYDILSTGQKFLLVHTIPMSLGPQPLHPCER